MTESTKRGETIVLRQQVDAVPAKVWAALCEPVAVASWLAEHADIALDERRYAFWGRFSPGRDDDRQTLLEAIPERRLRLRWPLDGHETEVDFEIDADSAGTQITLTHTDAPPRAASEVYVRDWWQLSLDNLANFVEARSLAAKVDFTALKRREVRYEVEIDATREAVFAALIDPDQLERWIATDATVEPKVGGRYDFGWGLGPTRILELVPSERLAFDWRMGDDPDTVVRWELDGSGGRTHLTVVQSGFVSEERAGGWTLALAARVASLKRMLEVGPAWRPVERLQHAA